MPLALHRIGFDLSKLKQDGCELSEPPEMFHALMVATNGDPCLTGCAYFNNGKCLAYQKHHTKPQDEIAQQARSFQQSHSDQSGLIGGKWSGKSIRQIAKIEGVSLNEARRRKQAGLYRQ